MEADDAGPSQSTVPTVEQLTRVVALDGPAGSGKSTVARAVARALGWRFVDTGATYRAVTLAVLRGEGLPAALLTQDVQTGVDPQRVADIARKARVELSTDPAESWVRLNGEDVTSEIRGPEVTAAVSAVSAVPTVRAVLIDLQRRAMGTGGAVVEGRDISTVVAPAAAVKVYLDASAQARARRRAGQVSGPETSVPDLEATVAAALAARDALDHQTNKLEASDGAVHLDTTELSVDQVVEVIVALVDAAGLSPATP